MKRSARMQAAVSWLKRYSGKHVLKGYCRHYGVDWRCAAFELKQLGIHLDPDYLKQRVVTEQQLAESREQCREAQIRDEPSERWYDYDSPLEAYLAEDYEVLYAMECELNKHGSDEDQL